MSKGWQNIQFKVIKAGSRINLLIWINVAVFLLVYGAAVVMKLIFNSDIGYTYAEEYLRMPSYLPKLLIRFWTPLTYMFMHAGVFHILFNMLWLYWMGQIFEEYLGNKRTIGLYILGGLSGGFMFVLFYNVFPFFTHTPGLVQEATIVGASASVMAVIVATATLLPDHSISMMFLGAIRLRWIALFFVLVDFLAIVGPNAGGEIAHLGGAMFGFIYIRQLQRGNDMVGFFTKLFSKAPKLNVVSKNNSKNTDKAPRQEEIDRILDKISQSGYDSLSKQEKEILFRASKNNEG